ncbi:MAG: DUF3343 domain-containing protein [Anaerolineae bacterium]|nr:DUF3343 domain-containing protein [Anaerolineae bacterium]
MKEVKHVIILTHSTGHAIRVEKVLNAAGLSCKLIPVPRYLSSDCGICVQIEAEYAPRAIAVLKEAGVTFEGVYEEKVG